MNHFTKKNEKLEKLRGIFFQLGLIIAGGLILLAFEWKSSYVIEPPDCQLPVIEIDIDVPPITFQNPPEKPKVKIIPTTFNPDQIDIIDDNTSEIDPSPAIDPNELPDFVPDLTETNTTPKTPEIFTIVEKMPQFIGGEKARLKYLRDNLNYPSIDKSAGIEGTVYLKFLINKKGEIKKVKILRGVSETIDREAVRVVKAMPNWSPGKQRGKTVNVSYNFRISFKLN